MMAKIRPLQKAEVKTERQTNALANMLGQQDSQNQENVDQLISEIQQNEEADFRGSSMVGSKMQKMLNLEGSNFGLLKNHQKERSSELVSKSVRQQTQRESSGYLHTANNRDPTQLTKYDECHNESKDSIIEQYETLIKLQAQRRSSSTPDSDDIKHFDKQTSRHTPRDDEKDGPKQILNLTDGAPPISKLQSMMKALGVNFKSKMINISEYTVNFNIGRFIKQFFYHIIFFFFGPLVVPLIAMFDTLALSQNMGFMVPTKMRQPIVLQYFQWMVNVIFAFLWAQKYFYFLPEEFDIEGIYIEQYIFYNLMLVIRSFIISVRYGYCSELRYSIISQSPQDMNYLARDLLLFGWVNLSPQGLNIEIDSVLWRNQVEESHFQLHFLEDLEEKYAQKLTKDDFYGINGENFKLKDLKKEMKDFKNRIMKKQTNLHEFDVANQDYEQFTLHSFKKVVGKQAHPLYSGRLLLREMALFSAVHQPDHMKVLFLIIMTRMAIPYVLRYMQYGNPVVDFTWVSILYSALEFPTLGFLTFANFLFVIAGFVDFQRRVSMIRACGALLNPFKNNLDIKYQLFPTVNLACKRSINTWFELRNCIMDFGRKYMNRIFIYSSTFMGCYLFFAIILLLKFFEFITIELSVASQVIAIYDITIVLGVNLSMLYFGAVINHQFIDDRLMLLRMKQVLIFIKLNMDDVVSSKFAFQGPYLKNYQKVFKEMSKKMSQDEMKDHTDDLVDEIDGIIERLEIDGEHRPLRLLGLKATFELMNSIYTTLLTVGFAIAQKMVSSGQ